MVRLRFILFCILVGLCFYFAYFAYHLSKVRYDNPPKILQLESKDNELGEREKSLQNIVDGLDDSIDRDLLDEEVRRKLRYLDDDELVLPLRE